MASASTGSRVVLHVDMDAFYAAVEIRENPELEGKPVVVGADPRRHPRGVVLTASYEARRYGLRSAMSCVEALRRCPEAIFVQPHFELYGRVSGEIMATLRGFADRLEPSGIEEGYLDVTNRCDGNFSRAQEIARNIKAAVRRDHRLSCSIGIAPTKALAKIASDFEKPDGLTVVSPDDVVEFLAPIPVRKISGVGPKTAERLKEPGLESLARSLHEQLLLEKYAYRTVTLKARYSNFETHTRSRSLKIHTTDLGPILILSQMMLKEVLAPDRKVRLIGVRLSHLKEHAAPQATLAKWSTIPPN